MINISDRQISHKKGRIWSYFSLKVRVHPDWLHDCISYFRVFEHEAVKVAPEGEANLPIFTRLCAEIVERRAHACN